MNIALLSSFNKITKSFFYVFTMVCVHLCSLHEAKKSMVYSYTKSFNAFAAKLSDDEARKLSGMRLFLLHVINPPP